MVQSVICASHVCFLHPIELFYIVLVAGGPGLNSEIGD